MTIQEINLTPKANTPKVHNFTTMRADRLHRPGGGFIAFIKDNIAFTTTDIPSTINTHNTALQMVKVHINNTKHITIVQSTYYKTADMEIQHCIQYIAKILDDITITSTHTSTSAAKKYIQPYLHKVFAWTNQNNFTLNPDKTTCTLFTPDPQNIKAI